MQGAFEPLAISFPPPQLRGDETPGRRAMKRYWTINGRFLTQPVTGVQRYGREILTALDGLVGDGHPLTDGLEIEVVAPRGADAPALHHIPVRIAGRLGGHLWEQTELPMSIRGGLLSLCNTGPLAARRHIVCIHDLNPRAFPESYARSFRLLYSALLPMLARRAVQVVTVSEFSAGELAAFRMIAPGQAIVIPNGHEHAVAWESCASPPVLEHAAPNTIVLLGSLAPHKNARLILDLSEELRQAGLRIAVVGQSDPAVFARAQVSDFGPNVAWLGRLSDGELKALLEASLCLAFPSLQEGFGLPPLEAMAVGCPVLVSDRTSLPEVCGSAALYASPAQPRDWLELLVALHRDPTLRARMSEQGRRRALEFSWRRSAEQYLEAFLAADQRSKRGSAQEPVPASRRLAHP